MRRGTTPILTVKVKGTTFEDSHVSVVIRQGEQIIKKAGKEITILRAEKTATLQLRLTQEETLKLKAGKALFQLRWVKKDGRAYASQYINLRVQDVLNNEVITYG